jgi:hypothetical protein
LPRRVNSLGIALCAYLHAACFRPRSHPIQSHVATCESRGISVIHALPLHTFRSTTSSHPSQSPFDLSTHAYLYYHGLDSSIPCMPCMCHSGSASPSRCSPRVFASFAYSNSFHAPQLTDYIHHLALMPLHLSWHRQCPFDFATASHANSYAQQMSC